MKPVMDVLQNFSRNYIIAALAALIFIIVVSICQAADAVTRKPNIILVLADDLGWAELGCYGNTFSETPHLDRLAREGIRFTNAYAPAPVCSPTRASLLTGQYPARIGIIDYLRPDTENALARKYITIAERLKNAGYATGMIGKWHLTGYAHHSSTNEVRAVDQGFDEELITEIKSVGNGANFYPYVFRDQKVCWLNVKEKRLPGNEYLVDRMNLEVVEFIERHKDRPFFLYLSHFATHTILNGKPKLVRKYLKKHPPLESRRENCYLCQDIGCYGDPGHHWSGEYNPHLAAMLESIDDGIGMIMEKLNNLNLTEDTLVIFTSDNGGESNVTTNGALRAGKSTLYEGGIRVPLIISKPALTPPGEVCMKPVNIVDFYPTLLDFIGLQPTKEQVVDGISIMPLLKNPRTDLQRDTLFWHYPLKSPHFLGGRSAGALRSGDWKLIEFYDTNTFELYDLSKDIGETSNLAHQYPQKAEQLRNTLRKWRKSITQGNPILY